MRVLVDHANTTLTRTRAPACTVYGTRAPPVYAHRTAGRISARSADPARRADALSPPCPLTPRLALRVAAADAARLSAVGRLHALRELPYTHGSALGFGRIMREVADLMESRLDELARR